MSISVYSSLEKILLISNAAKLYFCIYLMKIVKSYQSCPVLKQHHLRILSYNSNQAQEVGAEVKLAQVGLV